MFPTVVVVVPANGSWPCLMRMALSRWVELVELLERSVEAEQHEPGLAGQGLDPVRLLTLGRGGAEVQVVGAVGVTSTLEAVHPGRYIAGGAPSSPDAWSLPARAFSRSVAS